MGNEIVKQNSGASIIRTFDDANRAATAMAASGFFADSKQAAQALVKILAGQELGFGPFASMTGVYIIQGRPALSANLLAAAVKRSGRYNYRVTRWDDTGCEIAFFESGQECGRSAFTLDDARRAGLLDKDLWKKYPRNLCFARAMSNGVRVFCPDVMGGTGVYTPEELGESDVVDAVVVSDSASEPLPAPPQAQAQTTVRAGEHPHLRAVMREFPEIGEDILAAVLRGAAHTLTETETVDYVRAYSAAKRAGDTNPTYEAQAAVSGDMSIVVAQAWRTKSGAPVFSALTGAQLENIADDPKSSPLTKQAAWMVLRANARAAQDNVPQA